MSEETDLKTIAESKDDNKTSNETIKPTTSSNVQMTQQSVLSTTSSVPSSMIRTIPPRIIALNISSDLSSLGTVTSVSNSTPSTATIQIQRPGVDGQIQSSSISQNQLQKLIASGKVTSQFFKQIQVPIQQQSSLASCGLNTANLVTGDKGGKQQSTAITLVTNNTSDRSTLSNANVISAEDASNNSNNATPTAVSAVSASTTAVPAGITTLSSVQIIPASDGLAVCSKCNNFGMKENFVGKNKQFCSTNCMKNQGSPIYKIVQVGSKGTPLPNTSNSSDSMNMNMTISIPMEMSQSPVPMVETGSAKTKIDKKEIAKKGVEVKKEIIQSSLTPIMTKGGNIQAQKVIIRPPQSNGGKVAKMLNSKQVALNFIQSSQNITTSDHKVANSTSSNDQLTSLSTTTTVSNLKPNAKRNYSKTSTSNGKPVTQHVATHTLMLNEAQMIQLKQQNQIKSIDGNVFTIQAQTPLFNTTTNLTNTSNITPAKRNKRASSSGVTPKRSRSKQQQPQQLQQQQSNLNYNNQVSVNSITMPATPTSIAFQQIMPSIGEEVIADIQNVSAPVSSVSTTPLLMEKNFQLIQPTSVGQFLNNASMLSTGVSASISKITQSGSTSSPSSQSSNILIGSQLIGPSRSNNSSDGNSLNNVQLVSTDQMLQVCADTNSNVVGSNQLLVQLGNGNIPGSKSATIPLTQESLQFVNTSGSRGLTRFQQEQFLNSKLQQMLQQQQQQFGNSNIQSSNIDSNPTLSTGSMLQMSNTFMTLASTLPGSSRQTSVSYKNSALASALAAAPTSVMSMSSTLPLTTAAAFIPPKPSIKEQIDKYEHLIKEAFNQKSTNMTNHNHCHDSQQSSISKLWLPILQNDFDKNCCSLYSFSNMPLSKMWRELTNSNNLFEIKLNENEFIKTNDMDNLNSSSTMFSTDYSKDKLDSSEAITTNHQDGEMNIFWFVTIVKTAGFYICVRFYGLEDSKNDFWINLRQRDLYRLHYAQENGFAYRQPTMLTAAIASDSSLNTKLKDLMKSIYKMTLPFDSLYQEFVRQISDTNITVGTRVEVLDKTHLSLYRVGTVDQVAGDRVHVIYDGEPADDKGLWTHPNHGYIRPVGWSQMVGHPIFASQSYVDKSLQKSFARFKEVVKRYEMEHSEDVKKETKEQRYQRLVNSFGVLNDCETFDPNTQIKEGMKLEVVDPLNLSAIVVATVERVLRFNFLMISIDSTFDTTGIDWFCAHSSSPYLLPPGFAKMSRYPLTSLPATIQNDFDWENFLNTNDSLPVPQQSLSYLNAYHSFEEGMLLEAVDLVEPNMVCIAVIKKISVRLLLLHFIGWGDAYNQWCDCNSPNIFPIGYCDLIDYPLQGPQSIQTKSGANDKKKKQQPNRRKRKSNASSPRFKSSTSSSTFSSIVSRKFGDPPTFAALTYDKDELKKFLNLTLEEMFNSAETISKGVLFENENNPLPKAFHGFRVDNQIKNERPFFEFNTLETIVSPYIIINGKERLTFKQNFEPIEYKFTQPEYNFILDNSQVRLKHKLDSIGFLDNFSISKITKRKFLYRDADIRANESTDILKWNSHQVAKFLMQNDFDELYDELVINGIDGQKLYSMTPEMATKVTGGVERRTQQLLSFVQDLKRFIEQRVVIC